MTAQRKSEVWRKFLEFMQLFTGFGIFGLLVILGSYKEKIDRVITDVAKIDVTNTAEHQQIKICVIKLGNELTQLTNKPFDFVP